ncbi:MAG: hypothetical protein AAF961_13830, partial [Planctomycetota bacterium]
DQAVTVDATEIFFESLADSLNVVHDFPNTSGAIGNFYMTDTGQVTLNNVINTQAWDDSAERTLTLNNLVVGQDYRLQVLGAGDERSCCSTRIHEVGSFDGGQTGIIDRLIDADNDGDFRAATAIADFTADATTQTLVFDDVGNGAAFSALILTSDEPGMAAGLPQVSIDRATGEIVLANVSPSGFTDLIGYSLTSEAGSFDRSLWTSIAGNYDQSNGGSVDPNNDWARSGAPDSATDLTESASGAQSAPATLNPNQEVDLGTAWMPTPFEDVLAEITLADDSSLAVTVVYTGDAIVKGDLDGNGAIDADDWSLFKNGSNTDLSSLTAVAAYQHGDLDANGVQNLSDFAIFQRAFDAANGAGALAALRAVPEPSGLTLAAICVVGALAASRRRLRGKSIATSLVASACLLCVPQASAAPVSWGDPTPVTLLTDIDLTGTLVHAGSWGHYEDVDEENFTTINVDVGSETIPFDGFNTPGGLIGFNDVPGINADVTAAGQNANTDYYPNDTGNADFNE